jgi:hypothetical protein
MCVQVATLSTQASKKLWIAQVALRSLNRVMVRLSAKQSSEVKRLLTEYEGLFAASDSDYGRTSKNVSFASTNISVSYVNLFAESSTAPLIIISL